MDPSTFARSLMARTDRWGYLRRYAAATVAVAAVTLLRISVASVLEGGRYFLFVFAVALCATFLDWGAALWASVLSAALIDYLFFEPVFQFTFSTSDALALTLFMLGCLLVIIAGQSVRLLVEQLNRTSAEKDALYRELRHRTANNLHLIGTTVALEAARARSAETRDVLKGTAARIAAIGQVDHLLVAHGISGEVDAGEHLRELCGYIAASLIGRRPVTLSCEAGSLRLPRDRTETLGIAVNELVTNALKHAFADGMPGHIRVGLAPEPGGLVLTVEDDGLGCDGEKSRGIGWRLVSSMISKHGGAMDVGSAEPGCRVRIRLPRAPEAATEAARDDPVSAAPASHSPAH